MRGFRGTTVVLSVIIFSLHHDAVDASDLSNRIDAFTSATIYNSLKVDTSSVCKTFAVINWKEYYSRLNVLAYRLKWGTKPHVYTDSIDLLPRLSKPGREFENTQPYTADTLKNLTENSEYFAEFYRDYNGIASIVTFRFNTPPLPTIEPVAIGFFKPVPPIRTANRVSSVAIYTLTGEKMANVSVTSATDFEINLPRQVPAGMYISTFKNSVNSVLATEKIVVDQ